MWVNRRGSTKLHFVLDLENEGEKVNNVIKKRAQLLQTHYLLTSDKPQDGKKSRLDWHFQKIKDISPSV